MHKRLLPITLLLLSASACMTPIHPRSAEVAAPLELSWDTHVPLTTLAPGKVTGVGVENPEAPTRVELSGLSGQLGDGTAATILPFWWELEARVGIFAPCELGAFAGLLRLGGELRCQVLDEDEGPAPFSLAASGAAAFLPLFERNAGWFRGGVDLSRRFATWSVMTNLYVSRGLEGHRLELGEVPDNIGFDEPDPNQTYDGESIPYVQIARQETRLALALGVGFPFEPGSRYSFIVGLVPYVTVDAGEVERFRCGGCDALEVEDFEEDFGVSITIGFSGGP